MKLDAKAKNGVIRGLTKLYMGLYNLYSLLNIVREAKLITRA
jgi:hypothetical protein